MNIFEWVRHAADGQQPIDTLIDALRNSDPGVPIWRTLGGAIDETTTIGHAVPRWFGHDPDRSIAQVVPIADRLDRVPRFFTRPICIRVVRGEQVAWLVIQDGAML